MKSRLSLKIYIYQIPALLEELAFFINSYLDFITNILHLKKHDITKRVQNYLFENEILYPLHLLSHRQRSGWQRLGNPIQRQ